MTYMQFAILLISLPVIWWAWPYLVNTVRWWSVVFHGWLEDWRNTVRNEGRKPRKDSK